MRFYYSSGLPFDRTLAKNLDELIARIKIGKAVLVIIDGNVGEGKTTMLVHVLDYFNGAYVKNKQGYYDVVPEKLIDLRRQYAMGGNQFQEKLQMCIDSFLRALGYDEAGDFNKRGSLTGFNQQLNRVFETYRTFGIPVVVGLPSASVLDKDLFIKGIPRMTIHLENRQKNYGHYRVYSLYRMMHVMDKMKKAVVPQQSYAKTVPNFYGQFLDLPPARAKLLREISEEGKRAILTQGVLKNRGLVALPDLAKNFQITKQYANLIIRKLQIKENSTFKRVRYFDQDAVAKVGAELGRGRGNK